MWRVSTTPASPTSCRSSDRNPPHTPSTRAASSASTYQRHHDHHEQPRRLDPAAAAAVGRAAQRPGRQLSGTGRSPAPPPLRCISPLPATPPCSPTHRRSSPDSPTCWRSTLDTSWATVRPSCSTRTTAGRPIRCCGPTSASGRRSPRSGHTGTPYLGNNANQAATSATDPFAEAPRRPVPDSYRRSCAPTTSSRSASRSGVRRASSTTKARSSSSPTTRQLPSGPTRTKAHRWPSAPTRVTASPSR